MYQVINCNLNKHIGIYLMIHIFFGVYEKNSDLRLPDPKKYKRQNFDFGIDKSPKY